MLAQDLGNKFESDYMSPEAYDTTRGLQLWLYALTDFKCGQDLKSLSDICFWF